MLSFVQSLFNSMSTFVGYLMPKPSLLNDSTGTIQTIEVARLGSSCLSKWC